MKLVANDHFKAKKAKNMTYSECLEFFCETKSCKKTYCVPPSSARGGNGISTPEGLKNGPKLKTATAPTILIRIQWNLDMLSGTKKAIFERLISFFGC